MASYFVKSGVLTAISPADSGLLLEIADVSIKWNDDERWNRRKLDLKVGDVIEVTGKVHDENTRTPSFEGKALYVATTDETYGVPIGIGSFVMFIALTAFACLLALLSCTVILAPATAPALFIILGKLPDFFVTRKCWRMLPNNAGDTEQLAPAE
ncbi:MAG: hypothetical protein OIF51_08850 [Cellvibrionaceae bacterium]|nr:hypothetical protein [Cellvibrionaceae bacterium]